MKLAIALITGAVAVSLAQTPDQQAPAQQPAAQTPQSPVWKPSPQPAEMKTLTYKGVLIDASCKSPTADGQPAPSQGTAQAAQPDNSANRTAGDCALSSSSSQFGMKLNDGRTVRFDMVGNQRAQDELKNNKRWSKDLAAGKPIHATVDGVLTGDKLVVSAIH